MSDNDSLKPYDPVSLVLDTMLARFPIWSPPCRTMADKLAEGDVAPAVAAMALLFTHCPWMTEAGERITPVVFWQDVVNWSVVDPATVVEGEGGRDHVMRMLETGQEFDFKDPDITSLRGEWGEQTLLLTALYWAAIAFAQNEDPGRDEAAHEVVYLLGRQLGLPDEVPTEA